MNGGPSYTPAAATPRATQTLGSTSAINSDKGALVVLAAKGGINAVSTRDRYPRIAELPFDAACKLMATFHQMTGASGKEVIRCFVKGAPDQLLARAATVADAADGAFRRYLAENQRLGEQGLR